MKMRNRAAIVLALLAVQWAAAATYYVATTGSDSAGGTEAAPWLTIQKFLDTAATGDTCRVRAGTYTGSAGLTLTRATHENKTMTIEAYGDGAVIVTDTAAAQAVLLTGTTWTQAATYTFKNIEFRPAAASVAVVYANITGTFTIIFDRCTLGGSSNNIPIFKSPNSNNTKAGVVRFRGCTLNASNVADGSQVASIAKINTLFGEVEISGCSITISSRWGVFIGADVSHVNFSGNTITSANAAMAGTSYGIFYVEETGTHSVDRVTFAANACGTIACQMISIPQQASYVYACDNTASIVATAGAVVGMRFGKDGAIATYPPGIVVCLRNRITMSGANQSHGILFGRGLYASRCEYNVIVGGNDSLVIKAESSVVKGNVIYHSYSSDGYPAVYLRSPVGIIFEHNLVYSTINSCVKIDHNLDGAGSPYTGANTPTRNIFTNNVLMQGTANANYCISESNGTDDANSSGSGNMDESYVDDNVYLVATTGKVAFINDTACTTLAATRTAWDAYADNCSFNDANSFSNAAVACADVNAAVTIASQWPVVGEQRAMNFRIGAFQTEPGERCTVRVRTSFDVMTN